jgi:hypothetical protein
MTSTYTPTTIGTGYGEETKVNENLVDINVGLDQNLSRSLSADNAMEADLDMGSFELVSVGTTHAQTVTVPQPIPTVGTEVIDLTVTNTPAGNIAATSLQAAINELDTEKSATGHTHTLTDVTDSGTVAALDIGTSASQVLQLDSSAKLPAVDGSQITNLPHKFPSFSRITTSSSFGSGNATVLTHGLGSIPSFVSIQLVCIGPDLGYSIGDIISINFGSGALDNRIDTGISVTLSSTTVSVRWGNDNDFIRILRKNNGRRDNLREQDWDVRITAYK